jgi:tryptophanase
MGLVAEPYRIKSVEPLRRTSLAERKRIIREADYNIFALRARDISIDLLTDSGTSAMSARQWSALMQGDESYAGADSFFRFESAVKNLMPFRHVIPTHQGRAAEAILSKLFGGPGKTTVSNTHFDTTRGNIEASGATALDLNIAEGRDSESDHPFKGNMDIDRLSDLLADESRNVSLVMLTLTNNAGGGQPVSLENIRATRSVCDQFGKPFYIDACRFAENAWFIKQREAGQQVRSVTEIAREIFSVADGVVMSAKKDGLANIGGWLAMNDDELATEARNQLILTEGFYTYGGLAGRDLDAIAVGLEEVVDEAYLEHRVGMTKYFGEGLDSAGVPVIKPFGGHAVFVDARALLPHIPPLEFPGQVLSVALYEEAGVRAAEFGSVMWGRQADGTEKEAPMELVRLALPRRVYTRSHYDAVIDSCARIVNRKEALAGMKIVWEAKRLRHFTARFAYR